MLANELGNLAIVVEGQFVLAASLVHHSGIRVQLPWPDKILVTPQVHRIHHSIETKHYSRNFADVLPIFDAVFGTYHRPGKDEFPPTGARIGLPSARSLWTA